MSGGQTWLYSESLDQTFPCYSISEMSGHQVKIWWPLKKNILKSPVVKVHYIHAYILQVIEVMEFKQKTKAFLCILCWLYDVSPVRGTSLIPVQYTCLYTTEPLSQSEKGQHSRPLINACGSDHFNRYETLQMTLRRLTSLRQTVTKQLIRVLWMSGCSQSHHFTTHTILFGLNLL